MPARKHKSVHYNNPDTVDATPNNSQQHPLLVQINKPIRRMRMGHCGTVVITSTRRYLIEEYLLPRLLLRTNTPGVYRVLLYTVTLSGASVPGVVLSGLIVMIDRWEDSS